VAFQRAFLWNPGMFDRESRAAGVRMGIALGLYHHVWCTGGGILRGAVCPRAILFIRVRVGSNLVFLIQGRDGNR
jgi:hypothetical protein